MVGWAESSIRTTTKASRSSVAKFEPNVRPKLSEMKKRLECLHHRQFAFIHFFFFLPFLREAS